MRNRKSILVLSILALMGAGCSRPSGGSAKVVIEIPNSLDAQSKVNASTTSDVDDDDEENEDNNIIAPKDISKLNCFVAAVGGPEETLKRNKCGRKNPTGSAIAESSAISIGSWVHGNAGESLELSVTAGNDRIFYIFGAYAKDKQTCSNLKNSTDDNKLSRFYMLGKSANMTIEGGVDSSVAVNISLDRENYIDECDGPDFLMESKDIEATKVNLVKEQFPANVYVEGVCQQIKVTVTDDLGRAATLPAAASGEITLTIPNNGLTNPGLYPTSLACTTRNDSGGSISVEKNFSMPAGTSEKVFWVVGATGTDENFLKFNVTLGSLSTTTPSMAIQPYDSVSYEISGSDKILPDRCYDYSVFQKRLNGDRLTSSGTSETVEIKNESSGSKISLSLSPCSSRSTASGDTSIEVPLDTTGMGKFSVIAKSVSEISALQMSASKKDSSISPAPNYLDLNRNLLVQPGSTHPIKLDILNKYALTPVGRGACQPATVIALNENGTAIGLLLGDTSTNSSPELPLAFEDYSMHLDSDSTCADTNMAPKQVNAPSWSKSVMVKLLTTAN